MNKFTKTKTMLSVLLIFTMLIGCITGCGAGEKKGSTSATDIEIHMWNSGLGTEWMDAMIEGFKKVHPEYNVFYNQTASNDAVIAAYGLEDVDTTDLYLSVKVFDTKYMEPLNELLDSTAEGDAIPLKDKFNESYLAMEKAKDGNVYSLTYGGGIVGLVYNKKLFEQAGITTLPRTTDELAAVCNALTAKNIIPLCHFADGGYWLYLEEAWFGQYEGMDYYLNTFYGNPAKDTFLKKDGRYEVLKAMEKFVTPEYILGGSNSSDHTTMQTKFLKGEAAMMVSGSWLANEMKASENMDNFATMKLPVLSSITDKLTTVTKESQLRKVIDAIDSVTDGTADVATYKKGEEYIVDGVSVSKADWDYLYAARNTVPDIFAGQTMYIPTYSNAKEGAKEFIKFVFSDQGYKIYTDVLHIQLPIQMSEGEVDTAEWTEFEKSQVHLMNTCVQSFSSYNRAQHDLFCYGGATLYAGESFVERFCTKNEADRIGADKVWDLVIDKVNDNYEKTWLANIK